MCSGTRTTSGRLEPSKSGVNSIWAFWRMQSGGHGTSKELRCVYGNSGRYTPRRLAPINSASMPSEYIEIIEWLDDTRDTLSHRFPDDDRSIKRGAQLIVRESQAAQFVYLGQYGDTFAP